MTDLSGYLLHPSIPVGNPDIRIADIATGTGYKDFLFLPPPRSKTYILSGFKGCALFEEPMLMRRG